MSISSTKQVIASRTVDVRRAFTLVELLTVITIVTILIAILLPALSRARQSAMDTTCKNNLRQISLGLQQHTQNSNLFCSGAFDWRRDGCVTEVGWVADMVQKGILAGELLCPSNDVKLSETYIDLMNMVVDESTPGMELPDSCVKRLGSPNGAKPDGTPIINACRQIAAEAVGSEPRRKLIEELIYDKGFNTNYVATWFLVRSDIRTDASGNLRETSMPACPASLEDRVSTVGPLNVARLSNAEAPSTHVPIMACAKPVEITSGLFNFRMGPLQPGMTTESLTDGPVEVAGANAFKPPTFMMGTPFNGPMGWWKTWNDETRQDYRDFGPTHGAGTKRSCNILFADGSVRTFQDETEDGFLNNGFDPALYTGSGNIGYTSNVVELPKQSVYSGWSLFPGRKDVRQ